MSQFPLDLICFAKDPTFTDREAQSIAIASFLSLLAYSKDPTTELHRSQAQSNSASASAITKVWPLLGSNGNVLVAWSAILDTCFVAFRGTATVNDWHQTNLRTQSSFDESNNWVVHKGFQTRAASLPIDVISLLIGSHRTVLCGHSLGGALATLAGLAIPRKRLGNAPRNAWSDDAEATSRLSIVTFGAPSVLVRSAEERAGPPRRLRNLFHNVIDPDDIVPTAFNRVKASLKGVAAALEALGARPGVPGLYLRTALGMFGMSLDGFATGALTGGVIGLILAIFKYYAPDDKSYGAHIGNIILLSGTDTFVRMCEGNEFSCRGDLSRDLDFKSPAAAQRLANHHEIISYASKWDKFVIDRPGPPWAAHPKLSAEKMIYTIVPKVNTSVARADHDPAAQSIDFTVLFHDQRALHAFSHAILRLKRPNAEGHEIRRASLEYVITESIEIRFSFPLGNRDAESFTSQDDLWKALFEAAESVALVDILGYYHVVQHDGVLCPDLTTTRHRSTSKFIKTAMLRAVASQVEFTNDHLLDGSELRLSPDVLPIVTLIDRAITSAKTERFLTRLKDAYKSIEPDWRAPRTDGESGQPNHQTALIADAPGIDPVDDFVPGTARGTLRNALTRIVREATTTTPGTFTKETRLSAVADVPLLGEVLMGYTLSTIATIKGTEESPGETAIDTRASLICMCLIIHTQLEASTEELLVAIGPSILRQCTAVAGIALGVATALTLVPVLVAAGLGGAIISGSGLYYSRHPRPSLAYDQLLCSATEQLGVCNHKPMSTASAELALARFADISISDIKKSARSRQSPWPVGYKASDSFYEWIQYVALIGALRTIVSMKPAVGTLGQIRSGKSHLLTALFRLSQSIFKPGVKNANRTLQLRMKTTDRFIAGDSPGIDERNTRLQEASSLAIDLLDVMIVVINFSLIEGESVELLVKTLAEVLERRDGQPVCILLNRVDEAIDDNTIDDHTEWLDDVRHRKERFVNHLKRVLGKQSLEIITSAPHPTLANHRFVRRTTVSLYDIVHVSCLLNFEESAKLGPMRHVLRALRERGDLWGTGDVQDWLREVCPEAVPDF